MFPCREKARRTEPATLTRERHVAPQEVEELALELTADDGSITRVSLGDVTLEHDAITEIDLDPGIVPADLASAEVIVVTTTAPLRNDMLVQ